MKRLKKCLSCKTPFKWEVERYCPKCGWDSKRWCDELGKATGKRSKQEYIPELFSHNPNIFAESDEALSLLSDSITIIKLLNK